jgi:DNA segregation ATPase FtsK/SpoIIIE-like protein
MTHEIYRTEGAPSIEELTAKARKIVVDNKKASLSLVQRHLGIGYNMAARILETLETEGTVSVMDSSGRRKVLKK